MQAPLHRDDDSVNGISTIDSVSSRDPSWYPHLRPILVGYAFGPKKMSTMGIIMAEASKAKLSTVVTTEVPVSIETISTGSSSVDSPMSTGEKRHASLTTAALEAAQSGKPSRKKARAVQLSMAGGPNGSLRNIVRRFRSSCSSVAMSDYDDDDGTSTTATATTAFGQTSSSASRHKHHPVRVSFVPLDLDSPLEEQHGGKLDAILHKLTEDILCLSTMQHNDAKDTLLEEAQVQAMARVDRLNEYKKNHPQCCLVDHPKNVQTVMSRPDIAHVLQTCLVGVTSASGIPVRTPRYQVATSTSSCTLPLPVIAKPLQAAGTKKSHCMGVVLHKSGLEKVDTPCLLQEFCNHDAKLFKVYVLGDHVSVFERPSLSNLPTELSGLHDYVEFDSQRPYPTLQDFGGQHKDASTEIGRDGLDCRVTVEEIRPVVSVLAKAFGLELFGFDILVTSAPQPREFLVVDVNYFPSYKEVSNFPSLLANYLTQRAVDGRIKTKEVPIR